MQTYGTAANCLCAAAVQMDVAVVSVLPDAWLACDDTCKLAWARDWVRQNQLLLSVAGQSAVACCYFTQNVATTKCDGYILSDIAAKCDGYHKTAFCVRPPVS